MNRIFDILKSNGADEAAYIRYADCDIINQRLADKLDFSPKSVIIATVPYYTKHCDKLGTVSSYALAYDYHLLLNHIAEKSIKEARKFYPDTNFKFFGDHSPIDEKRAASKAGLGIIGMNSLLITKRRSSFVFLFEILTDLECNNDSSEVSYCVQCGRCVDACPTYLKGNGECLSSITQKKGSLTDAEIELIADSGCAWGCDICQKVCPHTISAIKNGSIYSNIDWFNTNVCPEPTLESISDDSDFTKRAYSWRGKNTILRNIKILNGDK